MSDPPRLVVVEIVGCDPVPQGSKGVTRDGRLFDTNSTELGRWRRRVRDACRAAWRDRGHLPITVPVEVRVQFRFTPTFSDPDRFFVAVKPDGDKLLRALYDGMTAGGLWRDDALAVRETHSKTYCGEGVEPGAVVSVYDLSEIEQERAAARRLARMRRPVPPATVG